MSDLLITSAHIHFSRDLLDLLGIAKKSRISVVRNGREVVVRVVDPADHAATNSIRKPRPWAANRYEGMIPMPEGFLPEDFGAVLEQSKGLLRIEYREDSP